MNFKIVIMNDYSTLEIDSCSTLEQAIEKATFVESELENEDDFVLIFQEDSEGNEIASYLPNGELESML